MVLLLCAQPEVIHRQVLDDDPYSVIESVVRFVRRPALIRAVVLRPHRKCQISDNGLSATVGLTSDVARITRGVPALQVR